MGTLNFQPIFEQVKGQRVFMAAPAIPKPGAWDKERRLPIETLYGENLPAIPARRHALLLERFGATFHFKTAIALERIKTAERVMPDFRLDHLFQDCGGLPASLANHSSRGLRVAIDLGDGWHVKEVAELIVGFARPLRIQAVLNAKGAHYLGALSQFLLATVP
jgi:hypothetical protein